MKKNLSFVKGVTMKGEPNIPELKRRAAETFLTPICQAEMACRIAEAVLDESRPDGCTATQALERIDDDTRQRWLDAADAVMEYFKECIMNAQQAN